MVPPLPGAQKKGTLVCVVLKARNLPNKRSIGKQDPYCVLTVNNEPLKTTPDKRGGQHPQWDQQLHFDIYDDLEELLAKEQLALDAATTGSVSASTAKSRAKPVKKVMKVACYADDQREPEFIGEGVVDLTETLKSGEFDEWVPLQAKDRYAGEVYLELTYYLDKAPPKKKKAPKPVAGSSIGGAAGESYGGAGVFIGEVDEDSAEAPPHPPSKHMPRPSGVSEYGRVGRTGGDHGNRSDRLSMTGSLSYNNLLGAPGRSNSPSPAAHNRRLSDIPAILRPSSAMANIDMYTPVYAQPTLQRVSSPQPPENGSSNPHAQHQPHSHHSEAAQIVANASSHAGWPSLNTAHQAQPNYNVVPPTPITSSEAYQDAASEIARSMAALSFAPSAHAPPPQQQQQYQQPYANAAPPPTMSQAPQYAYPPPPPSATPTPAMLPHGHAGISPAPSPVGPYQSGPGAPGSIYAHSTPPTLHGHYPLPPLGPAMHGTPPPGGPVPHQYQSPHQQQHQPLRQSSYPLAANPASTSLAPSPMPAHQHQPHSAPTTPAHDPSQGPSSAHSHSPASFHALPTLPPQQQHHQQQQQPGPSMYASQGPPPTGLVPMSMPSGPQRSSSPAPSMASIASMSSFQTYSHAPPPSVGGYGTIHSIPAHLQQQSSYPPPAAPSLYQQPPPQQQQQQQMYNAPPPAGQFPPHLQQQPQPPQQPLYMQQQNNGIPSSLAGSLPYAYPNGTANAPSAYGQPPPPPTPGPGMYAPAPPQQQQYAPPPGQQQQYQPYYNYGQ
ncbi:unnamed protein product [Tilletia laevis]|uniref:C2 domain-containing protein n=2 Tax=Tilletia TaxID=13289 RepID=A0A177VBZ9_9BASI|nr:hypothetical protein CF336_g779 [Tilletia laevis]KAE8262987.1 hypothetical protein A4X03_0g2027 [Tilletia caries]CAD6899520.1 unnamed protein product [Tilletia controversa]KAE8201926.1 hypothetical protein CF335_g3614 [Tilletia laevis]CAD6913553.1 unnamed protein product [Tilletia laevis]